MKLTRLVVVSGIVAVGAALTACGSPKAQTSSNEEAWNDDNDPMRFAADYETRLSALPTEGRSEQEPWSDFYWPSHKGGLANRWLGADGLGGFDYEPASREAALAMTQEELARLSPAEKYALFVGNYDHDLVAYERARTSPDDETWFGLCHGWAAAAINFAEPNAVTLTGPSGLRIPFGSSDIKGLLTFVQQYEREGGSVRFLGGRCNRVVDGGAIRPDDASCRDVNAGAFHIVLTNELGKLGVPFVADTTRDREVWNYPIHRYETRVLSETTRVSNLAAPGTVRVVFVETIVEHAAGSDATWDALGEPVREEQRYRYNLELDEDGRVIGGEWVQAARPDFLWTQSRPTFEGYFAPLAEIYEAATIDP